MDYGIYSLYSNLIDTKVKFCSLCFKIVTEDAACVQDRVILSLDEEDADVDSSKNGEVDIHYILQEVLGIKVASYLSHNDAICDICTRSAINSYKFIRMCKENSESMATAVDIFASTIGDANTDFGDHKTLFLSMNLQESTCTQYFDTVKFTKNKSALTRFQSLFRPYSVITDNYGNTTYKCTMCPAFYPKATTARRHFSSRHVEDQELKKEAQNMKIFVESPRAGRSYTKHDNNRTHTTIQDSDGKTKYKCKKCPMVCTKSASARRHFEIAHVESLKSTAKRLRTREACKDYVRQLNEICYVEITDLDGTTKYQCTECAIVCTNSANARRHFKTKHTKEDASVKKDIDLETKEQKPPTCNFCSEDFRDKYILIKHILKEHSKETFKDLTHVRADSDIYNYVYTVVRDENDCEKYRCKVCSKLCNSFTTVKAHFINIHLKLPKTGKLYICSHCGKECSDSFTLKRHEEHHTLKMTCLTCNKVYKSRVCFKQHVCFRETARNYMQKDFVCNHCGKKFVSKDSLGCHIRYSHDPANLKFNCQHCPKVFGTISRWKAHQVTHTRERNFTCDICGNVFVTQMALVYHVRIHTGERPYQCKHCDMRFLSSSRRADHVKRHHIAAMATCEICGVTVKAAGMPKHKRRHRDSKSTLYISKDSAKKRQVSKASVKKTVEPIYEYESDSE